MRKTAIEDVVGHIFMHFPAIWNIFYIFANEIVIIGSGRNKCGKGCVI